ncbi:MAG: DNA-binding response regulator [Methylocystaceae bacterium]|nr:DNA-binding response regulator [Methylocystaceae bacterium]
MKHILFVDDDANILHSMQRNLKGRCNEWDMSFFERPYDVLDYLNKEKVDVIIADMRMPELTGLELAKRIHQQHQDCRIIFLTGTADLQTAVNSINKTNVFRFYTKPCDLEDLCQGIEEALADLESESFKAIGNQALDHMPVGVCVVDLEARLLFSNLVAQNIFKAAEGIFLSPTRILRAENSAKTTALHEAIASAAFEEEEKNNGAIALPRHCGKRDLSIRCLPLGEAKPNQVLLFIGDPESPPAIDFLILSRLFGLTKSEAKLAAELSQGYTLEMAAEHIGLTISTARTYLKQVFAKTETNRQAELVKLVLTSPATIAG